MRHVTLKVGCRRERRTAFPHLSTVLRTASPHTSVVLFIFILEVLLRQIQEYDSFIIFQLQCATVVCNLHKVHAANLHYCALRLFINLRITH